MVACALMSKVTNSFDKNIQLCIGYYVKAQLAVCGDGSLTHCGKIQG